VQPRSPHSKLGVGNIQVQNSVLRNAITGGTMNRHAKRYFNGIAFASALLFLFAAPSPAQEKSAHGEDAGQQAASPASPGAEQVSLAKLAGDYDRVVKFLGPGAAGMPSFKGTAKFSVVLGGRFLMEESTDTVMGRRVDALRIYGYNNATRQFEMARMYTMSTAITMMTGTSSDGGKTIEYSGSTDNMGASRSSLHAKLHIMNDDEFEVTMSTTGDDGKDAPFQSTTYTRKK
jgi:hypothetical protein